jgi:hypothetical protein
MKPSFRKNRCMGHSDCFAENGRVSRALVFVCFLFLVSSLGHAQYQGPIAKDVNSGPTLRATAIFEWTGDLTKPTAARLVPVAVWDGRDYQPGGLYLAQPEPLTLETGTLYELEKSGTPQGTFQVSSAENLAGSWIGLGAVKPQLTAVMPKPPNSKYLPLVVKEGRQQQQQQSTEQTKASAGNTSAADADRPTLQRRGSGDGSSGGGAGTGNGSGSGASGQNPPDPDRPTLHKRTAPTNTGASVAASSHPDPDRPKLRYGKPEAPEGLVEPSKLEGFPADLEQMAAISDVKRTEPHSYLHTWYDPADEAKMRAAVEKLAEEALVPSAKTVSTSRRGKMGRGKAAPKPSLPELKDESFHVFELSWSSGVTVVFSAQGEGEYITLIAQTDFEGNPQVIFRQMTRDDRLDVTPRMKLVDVVDTDGDGRAELLFELRGTSGREFGIYRVANRSVEQVFHTGPEM